MNGSLQKKGNVWYAVIDIISNGKRKQKWISTKQKNKSEASKVMRDLLTKMDNDLYVEPSKVTFISFMEDWLDNVMKLQIEQTTLESYKLTLKAHIKPYFDKYYKGLHLQDLKTMHLQKYFKLKFENGRTDGKGGLSGNTLRKHKILINSCLEYAIKTKALTTNPLKDVVLPKKEKYNAKYYNAEQIEKLLQIVKGTSIETAIFITVYYGLRRGEVLGLRWEDINFNDSTITINTTRVRYSKVSVVKSPKTEKSRRTLPLIESVANYLKKLKLHNTENKLLMGSEYEDTGYICCWDNGKLYSTSYVSHKLKELLEQYDMPHIRFHDLRHSTASFLLKNGFSLKEIQEWLGHSDISTTANIYSHIDIEMKKNIANKINNRFVI